MKQIALLWFALAALTGAQPVPNFPWWDSPIVRDLNLSDDQMAKIRVTVRESRDRLIEQRAAVQKAEAALGDLFSEEQIDMQRAGQVVDRLVAARGELTRTYTL